MLIYDPADWYWEGPLGLYSSARGAIVPADDADFAAWLGPKDAPTGYVQAWPRDESGVQTAAALDAVLTAHGLPPTGLEAPTAIDLAPLIKAECGRRIYAVASDNVQKNTLANVATGALTGDDLATWKAGVAWIGEMQAASRALIAGADPTYAQDSHWPVVPAGVVELAARF